MKPGAGEALVDAARGEECADRPIHQLILVFGAIDGVRRPGVGGRWVVGIVEQIIAQQVSPVDIRDHQRGLVAAVVYGMARGGHF